MESPQRVDRPRVEHDRELVGQGDPHPPLVTRDGPATFRLEHEAAERPALSLDEDLGAVGRQREASAREVPLALEETPVALDPREVGESHPRIEAARRKPELGDEPRAHGVPHIRLARAARHEARDPLEMTSAGRVLVGDDLVSVREHRDLADGETDDRKQDRRDDVEPIRDAK